MCDKLVNDGWRTIKAQFLSSAPNATTQRNAIPSLLWKETVAIKRQEGKLYWAEPKSRYRICWALRCLFENRNDSFALIDLRCAWWKSALCLKLEEMRHSRSLLFIRQGADDAAMDRTREECADAERDDKQWNSVEIGLSVETWLTMPGWMYWIMTSRPRSQFHPPLDGQTRNNTCRLYTCVQFLGAISNRCTILLLAGALLLSYLNLKI